MPRRRVVDLLERYQYMVRYVRTQNVLVGYHVRTCCTWYCMLCIQQQVEYIQVCVVALV